MFLDDFKVTVEAPTATGTTTIDSAAYDMAGFSGICFVVRLGTPAANNNIRLRQDVASGGSYADLTGTLVNDAVKNQHMVGLERPGKQFIKCRVTRGTSTTIDSLVAIQYGARGTRPVTQATSIAEQYVSPIEGTA
jgi:hypothetical protein